MQLLLLISLAQISIILTQFYYHRKSLYHIKTLSKQLEQHTSTIKKLEDILFGFEQVRFPSVEQDIKNFNVNVYRELDEMHKEIAHLRN